MKQIIFALWDKYKVLGWAREAVERTDDLNLSF